MAVPTVDSAVFVNSDTVQIVVSQSDLVNKKDKHYVVSRSLSSVDNTSVTSSPFPIELQSPMLSVSPSGKKQLVIREVAETEYTFDIVDAHHLSSSIKSKDVHKKLLFDEWFGKVSWSPCENYIAYVAEKKIDYASFFDKEPKDKIVGDQYLLKKDLGETYETIISPSIYVVDVANEEIISVPWADSDKLTAGQVIWTPNGQGLAFVKQKLATPPGEKQTVALTVPVNLLGTVGCFRSPRFTPDGTRIVFLGMPGHVLPHNSCAKLLSIQWSQGEPTTAIDTLIDYKYFGDVFAGIYCSSLPTNPWINNDTLVFSTPNGSKNINYHGSTGYGKDFVDSVPGKVGELDVKDCLDTIDYLVKTSNGTLDSNRVGVIGGSHGGFLAAHLIGLSEPRVKVAVMRNPVIDISALSMLSDIPDWSYFEAGIIPDETTHQYPVVPSLAQLEQMRKCSPIHHLSNMNVPTLVLLGGKDLRCPPSQGLLLHHSLVQKGVTTNLFGSDNSSPHIFKNIIHPVSEMNANALFQGKSSIGMGPSTMVPQQQFNHMINNQTLLPPVTQQQQQPQLSPFSSHYDPVANQMHQSLPPENRLFIVTFLNQGFSLEQCLYALYISSQDQNMAAQWLLQLKKNFFSNWHSFSPNLFQQIPPPLPVADISISSSPPINHFGNQSFNSSPISEPENSPPMPPPGITQRVSPTLTGRHANQRPNEVDDSKDPMIDEANRLYELGIQHLKQNEFEQDLLQKIEKETLEKERKENEEREARRLREIERVEREKKLEQERLELERENEARNAQERQLKEDRERKEREKRRLQRERRKEEQMRIQTEIERERAERERQQREQLEREREAKKAKPKRVKQTKEQTDKVT
eukprot:gene1163-1332_t